MPNKKWPEIAKEFSDRMQKEYRGSGRTWFPLNNLLKTDEEIESFLKEQGLSENKSQEMRIFLRNFYNKDHPIISEDRLKEIGCEVCIMNEEPIAIEVEYKISPWPPCVVLPPRKKDDKDEEGWQKYKMLNSDKMVNGIFREWPRPHPVGQMKMITGWKLKPAEKNLT